MIKKIAFGAAALVGLLVIGAGIYTWDPLPKNPSVADLSAAASQYDVEIIRDTWGVPHIYGKHPVCVQESATRHAAGNCILIFQGAVAY